MERRMNLVLNRHQVCSICHILENKARRSCLSLFLTRLRSVSSSKIPVHKTMKAKATKNLDTHSSYISYKLEWKILSPFVNRHAIVSFLVFCHHNAWNLLWWFFKKNISNWLTQSKFRFGLGQNWFYFERKV